MARQIWTDEKRAEIRKLRQTLELALQQIDSLTRRAGRPLGATTKQRPQPITLELVREWLSPAFSDRYDNEVATAELLGRTKSVIVMTLCQRGPWRTAKELGQWLLNEHGIALETATIARILSELKIEGIAVISAGGWEIYWHNHAENIKVDDEWADPVMWTRPLTPEEKRKLVNDSI